MAGGITNIPLFSLIVVVALALSLHKCTVEAKVTHHVVGEDRGWDPSSDVASWAARRTFLVGDSLWFTYSSALESVVELGSGDDYEACDLTNPIRVYTDGLSKVSLEGEGIRYFASGNLESCKKGLKLPLQVKPRWAEPVTVMMSPLPRSETDALAEAPLAPQPMPSAGVKVITSTAWLVVALLAGLFFSSIAM